MENTLNIDFGVEDGLVKPEGERASAPAPLVPQFLYEGECSPAEFKPQAYSEAGAGEAGLMEVSPRPKSLRREIPPRVNPWDPRLIVDLAMNIHSLDEILPRYGLTYDEYVGLATIPSFRRELAVMIRELAENGQTFRSTIRTQAMLYLEELDNIIYDRDVPANVRLDGIKSAVKWGDLEPKEAKGEGLNATQINVNITF